MAQQPAMARIMPKSRGNYSGIQKGMAAFFAVPAMDHLMPYCLPAMNGITFKTLPCKDTQEHCPIVPSVMGIILPGQVLMES